LSTWESTTWLAIGASALAVLLLALVLVVLLVARRRRRREDAPPAQEPGPGPARTDAHRARSESARAQAELRWLRRLADAGAAGSLEAVLQSAVELAAELGGSAAAMLVLPQARGAPLVATFGLTAEEASRELTGLPPGGGEARAVALAYRYTEEELARDEFRLVGGLALRVADGDDVGVGTLAVFWRRVEREATDDELVRLEGLAHALGPALQSAFAVEELRREADLDPETGLHGRRSLERLLERECSRARRYEHPLSLLLIGLGAASTNGLLRWAAGRLRASVRAADVVFHLGAGRFATLLPEATRGDAERLARRVEPALTTTLAGGTRSLTWVASAELRDTDDAVSMLARAEAALAGAEAETRARAVSGAVDRSA
jgi:diguanylate cyclase (GGDEF)-like protein